MDTGLIYKIIRVVNVILSIVCLVYAIIDLVDVINANFGSNVTRGVSICVILAGLLIGLSGAYQQRREQLITGAIILLVALIVGFTDYGKHYGLPGSSIALVVLYAIQSELVRRHLL